MALLSTLLVGMLVAFKRNADCIRAQTKVRQATQGVDQLLMSWAEQGLYPPPDDQGPLPGCDGFRWQTRLASKQYRAAMGIDIVRLDVLGEREWGEDASPVLSLELVAPAAVVVAEEGAGA